MSLIIDLISQRSRDVIGRCQLSHAVIGCEDCKKCLVRKSLGPLLVKAVYRLPVFVQTIY